MWNGQQDVQSRNVAHQWFRWLTGDFAFGWLSTDLCPPSELRFVYEWGQQSITPSQNGAQSHKFIDQVVHVPIWGSQFRFRALCDIFGVLDGYTLSNHASKSPVNHLNHWCATLRDWTSCWPFHIWITMGRKPVFCSNRFKTAMCVERGAMTSLSSVRWCDVLCPLAAPALPNRIVNCHVAFRLSFSFARWTSALHPTCRDDTNAPVVYYIHFLRVSCS